MKNESHAEGDGWPPKKTVKTTNGEENSQKVLCFADEVAKMDSVEIGALVAA